MTCMPAVLGTLMGATALGTYAALQVLGRVAGSTAPERQARLPGRPPGERAPYGHRPRHLDRRAPDRIAVIDPAGMTPGRLVPRAPLRRVDQLSLPEAGPAWTPGPNLVREPRGGDLIPNGPPGTAGYHVAQVDAPHVWVVRSTTHIPPGRDQQYDARIVWAWSINLDEQPHGTTRVHLPVSRRLSPPWFAALYVATIIPADFVMAVGMLRGVKQRAESGRSPATSGRPPLPIDNNQAP